VYFERELQVIEVSAEFLCASVMKVSLPPDVLSSLGFFRGFFWCGISLAVVAEVSESLKRAHHSRVYGAG
jgi:hypothetical protein